MGTFLKNLTKVFQKNNKPKVVVIQQQEESATVQYFCDIAKAAKEEYLMFLREGIQLSDNWLESMLAVYQKQEHVGVVGIRKAVFQDRTRDGAHFIKPSGIDVDEVVEVASAIDGILISRTVYEAIGGFDTMYHSLFAEVDLCLRLLEHGFHNYVVPNAMNQELQSQVQSELSFAQQEQNKFDTDLFRGKWYEKLRRKMVSEKLQKTKLYTDQVLMVAIAYNHIQWQDKEQRPSELRKLAQALKENGYKVKYLRVEEGKDWYNVGMKADALVVACKEYDTSHMHHTKYKLVLVPYDSEQYKELSEQGLTYIKEQVAKTIEDVGIHDKEIDICGAMPNNDTTKFWGDWHYAIALKKQFEAQGYKANVLTREQWYEESTAKYILMLRGARLYYPVKHDNKRYIMWNISHPDDVGVDEYNLYDYIFFASDVMKDAYSGKIKPPCGVMYQCTDPEVMTARDTVEKQYDLLFVGNSRKVYRQILKDLLPTKHQLSVYGREWEEYPVKDYVVSEYMDNAVVGQAYHDAKILLNDHWEDMRRYGIISNRIFDALAVGAFIISDHIPEMEELFDGAVVTYKDKEDLNKKIDYYLEAHEVRREKAKRGQEIVLESHTFEKRVEACVQVMAELN